jgi:hypothetical protein
MFSLSQSNDKLSDDKGKRTTSCGLIVWEGGYGSYLEGDA